MNQYEQHHDVLDKDEANKNINAYVKEYQPIESNDISEIVKDIVLNSGLKNKGSQLDKIINLYAGESGKNSQILRKSIQSRVYKALGLKGSEKLKPKNER